MAIWKDSTAGQKEAPPAQPDAMAKSDLDFARGEPAPAARRATPHSNESVIGAEITIVGKIEGAGSIRIAGRFEGDVNIQGDLTIETGARVTGSVRANAVVIAGEIEGNVESAARVELQATGILNGDVKAGTLSVAAGSRMRGRAEFGWNEADAAAKTTGLTLGARAAS